jgi:hypothetical protein
MAAPISFERWMAANYQQGERWRASLSASAFHFLHDSDVQ